MSFNDLGLIRPILQAVEEEGYSTPTPIQQKAIPFVLEGRDLLGTAQTGTGKTAAFSIPILQNLVEKRQNGHRMDMLLALILTPTRELAIQIGESLGAYGRHTGLKHAVIFGGVGQKPQTDALARKVQILVATPGRLLDLIAQGFVDLSKLEIFVLDEADRMLDMGFIHDVKKVQAKLPSERQTLFFSATMPDDVRKLADSMLKNPASVAVAPVSSTAETVQQRVFFVEKPHKRAALVHVLKDEKLAIETALVFVRTKHGADKVARHLKKFGLKADSIHGDKAQNGRQKALTDFKEKKLRALVATDIAARGIDIDELAHVINFDLPNVPETYVHRIGRTGRAGASGTAISFCDSEERAYLKDIEKLIRRRVEPISFTGFVPPSDEELNEAQLTAKANFEAQKQQQEAARREKQAKTSAQQPKKQSLDSAPKAQKQTGQLQPKPQPTKQAANETSKNQSPRQPDPAKQQQRPDREQPKKQTHQQQPNKEKSSVSPLSGSSKWSKLLAVTELLEPKQAAPKRKPEHPKNDRRNNDGSNRRDRNENGGQNRNRREGRKP